MLRTGAPRSFLRSLQSTTSQSIRNNLNGCQKSSQWTSRLCTMALKRPQPTAARMAVKPVTATILRRQHSEADVDLAKRKLKPTPETVSTTSSLHPVVGEVSQAGPPEREPDPMKSIAQDFETIKETFALNDVPHQAMMIGLAGVLPYLGTSLATVYCAWEINNATHTGGMLMSSQSAELLLAILEPLQVGYGAVIISSLSTIHWGLEWAGYGGYQGYPRYMIGVIGPAIAWPTIMLPPIYALITQFLTFVGLYYVDATAGAKGWTPMWYGTYRFVLTFIVGASIVISLIGRGEIAEETNKLPSAADRVSAFRENREHELAHEYAAAERAKSAAAANEKYKSEGPEEEE